MTRPIDLVHACVYCKAIPQKDSTALFTCSAIEPAPNIIEQGPLFSEPCHRSCQIGCDRYREREGESNAQVL